jgi:beta-galactosidase
MAEHWNWSADGRKTIPVEVYTNCDSAELLLNGRSLGEKPVADRLSPVLRWEVPNQAGVVRVVGKRGGKEAARYELATAGAPQRVELAVDKLTLQANGSDLANIEIRVVDADGRRVFGADSTIEVQVSGAGELAAVDSGDPTDVTPVQASHRKAWQGRVLAIVRAGAAAGKIAVRASAAGLKAAEATVTVK